jgi:ABC-2 type transport system ATP-binding protein
MTEPLPHPSNAAAQGAAAAPLVVSIQEASRRFGDVVAVDNVTFAVPQSAIVGVIGPSGAGKTTTIRLMTGSLAPDDGVVRVLGEDPRKFRRRTRERIGYMPQLFVLYPELTTRENVDFMAALFGIPAWRRGRRVNDVLELVDLAEARNRRASQLSGGMQRRLELACALVHQPDLLILDEPTAGIDPLLRTRVWSEFERLRQAGVTILVTTQYVSEAEYCDAVALISEGQLVAYAPPEEMRKMAQGGEVFEVSTKEPLDVRALPPIEGVVQIHQRGPGTLLVVAANAGLATPLVNDAIEKAGGTVESSREYRPTFDEVFAALVTAHIEHRAGQQANGAGGSVPQGLQPR